MLGGLTGGAASKGTSRTRKGVGGAGGLALLAGAAGYAVKNRDKLSSMLGRGSSEEQHRDQSATTPPAELHGRDAAWVDAADRPPGPTA